MDSAALNPPGSIHRSLTCLDFSDSSEISATKPVGDDVLCASVLSADVAYFSGNRSTVAVRVFSTLQETYHCDF